MRRSSLPGCGSPSMIDRTSSAVRCSALLNTCRKIPVLARSAGISVVLRQPPLAYASKSSPGCTLVSMPARSMPITGSAGVAAMSGAWSVAAWESVGAGEQAHRAQIAIASRVGRIARMAGPSCRQGRPSWTRRRDGRMGQKYRSAADWRQEVPAMSQPERYPVPAAFAAAANLDADGYRRLYARSIADPDGFWAEAAGRLDWMRRPTRIREASFDADDFHVRWYADGRLNASVECLDRHLAAHGDKAAIVFEPDDPAADPPRISYRELHARVCRLANALRNLGIGKGDRVTIYLPMIPEAVVAMLACARIGAVHMVVFGGFAPHSIADRIADCCSKLVITADEGCRGGKRIPLKANVDAALKLPGTNSVETVL